MINFLHKSFLLLLFVPLVSFSLQGQMIDKSTVQSLLLLDGETGNGSSVDLRWIDSINEKKMDSIMLFLNQGYNYHVTGIKEEGKPRLSYRLSLHDFIKSKKKAIEIHEFGKTRNYNLFNEQGNLLKKGRASYADMTEYPKGRYIFIYDHGNISDSYQKK